MHYDEFYQDNEDKLFSSEEDDRRQREDNVLKQKEGKPEGARYCWIQEIKNDDLGLALNILIEDVSNKLNFNMMRMRHLISVIKIEIFNNKDKNLIINDLIKLRYDAIKSGKYKVDGYKQEIDINLLLDALSRHYIKLSFGDEFDNESGCLHLSHMLANVLIIQYQLRTYGVGDRV